MSRNLTAECWEDTFPLGWTPVGKEPCGRKALGFKVPMSAKTNLFQTQASMSTIVFLLPPRFKAVHDQQSALGTFFTINESICLRKRHMFLQIGRKASNPLPFLSAMGTLEILSKASLSFPDPSRSSWDEANILLTGHLILRSFKADSKLWKMSRTGWFLAVL